jgi:hypothetical protein
MNDHDEILRLKEENVRLKKELHGYEVHMASLCHKGYQVPDGEIKDEYQRIYKAIERWIRYALHDEPAANFGETFQDAIIIEARLRAFCPWPRPSKPCRNIRKIELAKNPRRS